MLNHENNYLHYIKGLLIVLIIINLKPLVISNIFQNIIIEFFTNNNIPLVKIQPVLQLLGLAVLLYFSLMLYK